MAYGDPMQLITVAGDTNESLLVNGSIELFEPSEMPTGWQCTGPYDSVTQQVAIASPGFWSVLFYDASFGTGAWGEFRQIAAVELPGSDSLWARGHYGMPLYAKIWLKQTGTATVGATLYVDEVYMPSTVLTTHSQVTSISGVAVEATLSTTITNASCNGLRFRLGVNVTGSGSIYLYVDMCAVYLSYTFAANPSMPDDQEIIDSTELYGRTKAGNLYMACGGATASKHQKTLHFGLVGLDQFKALRSLRLLKRPMRWTPNQPHMPASLDVRMTGYKMGLTARQGSYGSNSYGGWIELSEI